MGNSNDQPLTTQERGELLRMIKNYALDGYLRTGAGATEGFDKMWREAFDADVRTQSARLERMASPDLAVVGSRSNSDLREVILGSRLFGLC